MINKNIVLLILILNIGLAAGLPEYDIRKDTSSISTSSGDTWNNITNNYYNVTQTLNTTNIAFENRTNNFTLGNRMVQTNFTCTPNDNCVIIQGKSDGGYYNYAPLVIKNSAGLPMAIIGGSASEDINDYANFVFLGNTTYPTQPFVADVVFADWAATSSDKRSALIRVLRNGNLWYDREMQFLFNNDGSWLTPLKLNSTAGIFGNNVYANKYYGDGSALTGISGGSSYNITYASWQPNYTAYNKYWYNMTGTGTADFTNVAYINNTQTFTGTNTFEANTKYSNSGVEVLETGGLTGWGYMKTSGGRDNLDGNYLHYMQFIDRDSLGAGLSGFYAMYYNSLMTTYKYQYEWDVCDGDATCINVMQLNEDGISTNENIQADKLIVSGDAGTLIKTYDKDSTQRDFLRTTDEDSPNSYTFGLSASDGFLRFIANGYRIYNAINESLLNISTNNTFFTMNVTALNFIGGGTCTGNKILFNYTQCYFNGVQVGNCYTTIPSGYLFKAYAEGFHNGTTTFAYIDMKVNTTIVRTSAAERAAATNPTPFSITKFNETYPTGTLNITLECRNKTRGAFNGRMNEMMINIEVYKPC